MSVCLYVYVLQILARQDVTADYDLGVVLGRGQFGTTYLAVKKKEGKTFACKSIAKFKLQHPADVEDVKREVAIMHHLKVSWCQVQQRS